MHELRPRSRIIYFQEAQPGGRLAPGGTVAGGDLRRPGHLARGIIDVAHVAVGLARGAQTGGPQRLAHGRAIRGVETLPEHDGLRFCRFFRGQFLQLADGVLIAAHGGAVKQ